MKSPALRSHVAAIGVIAGTLLSAVPPVFAASTCTATSGRHTVPLVELYTSEGCDSCPPADRWLTSQFPPATRADGATTVLAFHVDYWDRLGWKDRFATTQFTQRQYESMRANAATFVYTPQVLVQGHDAAWQRGAVGTLVDAARQREARASVTLDAVADGERGYAVQTRAMVPDRTLRSHAVLWLAYADSGLVSDVKAGENRGVRLVHDYVVRSLAGPFPVGSNGEAHAQVNLARPAEGGKRPALVAIVQDGKTGEVLQTLAMPACAGP